MQARRGLVDGREDPRVKPRGHLATAVVQELKEKLCYVAMEPAKDRAIALETTALMERYVLPDGTPVKCGPERFEAPEALFHPYLIDVEGPGMSDLVFDVINAADIDLRAEFYQRIILSGGSTMYPGLPSRLEHDIRQRYLRDILKGDKSRLGVRRRRGRGWREEEEGEGMGLPPCLPCPCPGAEVQAQHRGPAAPQAHGLPRRVDAWRHHEGPRRLLDVEEGLCRGGRGTAAGTLLGRGAGKEVGAAAAAVGASTVPSTGRKASTDFHDPIIQVTVGAASYGAHP